MSIKGKLSAAFKITQKPKVLVGTSVGVTGLFIAAAVLASNPISLAASVVGATVYTALGTDNFLKAKGNSWSDLGNGIKHAPGKAAHKVFATAKKLVGKKPGL
jgi:hypothetical protein